MLSIDPEFQGKIPPLTPEEYRQLEENILAEGVVLSPLVVWNGLIVDGHNRYKILQAHPEVSYTTYEKNFPDRYAAIAWICKNQLGRRNLTPQQKKYLIGHRYGAEKQTESFHGNQYTLAGKSGGYQNDNHQKTCERIAQENHVGQAYVFRAEKYAQGVDAAEAVAPGIRQEILSGEIRPTEAAVSAVAKAPPAERRKKAEQLRLSRKERLAALTQRATEQIAAGTGLDIDTTGLTDREKDRLDEAIMCQIGESLSNATAVMGVADVLFELEDAADTLIDRWDLCMSTNPTLFTQEECKAGIHKIIHDTIQYLKNFEGGLHR